MMADPATDSLRADLDLALRAALTGARVSLPFFARVRELSHDMKADGTIVTEADRTVEQSVRGVLQRERPDDAFLGEETGESGSGPRRWILDGIDGTAVFVLGDDGWQSLVALEIEGQIVVGVAILPARNQVWWAARGLGAFVAAIVDGQIGTPRRLRVDPTPRALMDARLAVVPFVDALSVPRRALIGPLVADLVRACPPQPWPIHAALLVAAGEFDVCAQVLGQVWDFAPLILLVEEAGGHAGAPGGRSHPITGTCVFASTAALYRDAAALLR